MLKKSMVEKIPARISRRETEAVLMNTETDTKLEAKPNTNT